jgi:uridylate kinase
MVVVISLGGSMVFTDVPNVEYLKKFSKLMSGMKGSFGIAVGGGGINRLYVASAREFTRNDYELDMLGMATTYANARFVKAALSGSELFDNIETAADLLIHGGRFALIGGTHPGHSTDCVSALLAEKVEAERWVNLSKVDAVYDHDPSKYPGAKRFSSMTHERLVELAAEFDKRGARENFVVDLLATKILARSNIDAHFVNGNDLKAVEAAIRGKKHGGTVVKD